MLLLQATQLSHSFGIRTLFQDLQFDIHAGEKIGLVAPNGEGKSTLMRILAGVCEPETGQVIPYSTVGYVPQSLEAEGDCLVRDYFTREQASWQTGLAKEMGLQDHIWELPISSLSGGEQTKLALLIQLSRKPQLLLLDEPTNHLDLDTVQWLERKLKSARISYLVISHDRRFLDEVTDTTWDLHAGKLTSYPGSYKHYRAWVDAEQERVQKEYDEYQKEKKQLEEAIRRKQMWAEKGNGGRKATDTFARCLSAGDAKRASKLANVAKAMEKRLESMEPAEKPEHRLAANAKFLEIPEAERPVLVRGEDLTFAYGERKILDGVRFEIEKGDRIAFIGPNGTGKSTLLRLLTGHLEAERGALRITPTAKLEYFDQVFDTLNLDKSMLQELLDLPEMDRTTARLFLGAFLFKQDEVFRPLSTLSYGERVRFVFVKLILSRANLLVLDEPSNHLDIVTREKIEEALLDYPGAFLCASHDRYFLEKMTNKVWELRDGKLTIHRCGYKEYLERRAEASQTKPPLAPAGKSSQKQSKKELKEQLLMLENRIAHLSFSLSTEKDAAAKQQMDDEFIQLSREANRLRAALR